MIDYRNEMKLKTTGVRFVITCRFLWKLYFYINYMYMTDVSYLVELCISQLG